LGVKLLAALALLPLACAWGQDERRIVSPDGRLEFRIFVSQSERGGLSRLAYRVLRDGRPLVETSFLGFNIHNQEPFLGENDGLIGSQASETGSARSLLAHYMQNGSIGRLIDVEARVWNEGVALRYVIPPSTALQEILIDDELTEFDVPGAPRAADAALPFRAGKVWIAEAPRPP
jgi:alpha-glucosidase